jgi:AcrR family transcriptional regulator
MRWGYTGMEKLDLRVVKTKRNIRDTFIQLMKEKEFDDITVRELFERAMINRSTFYQHYADKYALAEAIAADFFKQFEQVMDRRAAQLDINNILSGVDEIFEEMTVHRDVLLALWKIRTEHIHVQEDMQAMLQKRFIQFHHSLLGTLDCSEYQAFLFTTIILANFRFFMEHREDYSGKRMKDEMTNFFNFIPAMGFRGTGAERQK